MNNKYVLVILAIHCSIFTMEEPVQVPKGKKGIFLKEIICSYPNPVRISQMALQKNYDGTELSYNKDYLQSHLAIVTSKGTDFFNRTITTDDLNKRNERSFSLEKVAEAACLRIEDLKRAGTSLTYTEAFIWLKKEFVEDPLNQIVLLYAGDKKIDECDGDEDTCTLITLKIANKKYLDNESIEIISETTAIAK